MPPAGLLRGLSCLAAVAISLTVAALAVPAGGHRVFNVYSRQQTRKSGHACGASKVMEYCSRNIYSCQRAYKSEDPLSGSLQSVYIIIY